MQPDSNALSPSLIEDYRRQMMEMNRRATPPSSTPAPMDEEWLDTHFPEPHFQQDRAAMASATAEEPPAPLPPIAESSFVGYLRVFTFTANEAEPIEGAHVVVGREDTIYANTATDRDGYTPVIPLPTIDPALTLQPRGPQPYVTYTIRVTADGFRPVIHENVPIYGNNYVTQPVALHPLLPGADPEDRQRFVSGGPINLQ